MSKKTVLLYNLGEKTEQGIKKICLQLGIKMRKITKEQYSIPIGMLLMIKDPGKTPVAGKESVAVSDAQYGKKQEIQDEMMIMDGFSEEAMDRFLARIKNMGISGIALKAVVTEYNKTWNSIQLYRELKKEHETFYSDNK